jgi:hypothetical protein
MKKNSKRAYWSDTYVSGAMGPKIRGRLVDQQTGEELGSYLYREYPGGKPSGTALRRAMTRQAQRLGYRIRLGESPQGRHSDK